MERDDSSATKKLEEKLVLAICVYPERYHTETETGHLWEQIYTEC